MRTDVPADVAPVHVDRAKHTSAIRDVEDVRPPIGDQDSSFAVGLERHEVPNLCQSGFGFRLTAQLGDDGAVHGLPPQFREAKGLLADRILDLAEEPSAEVVAEVGAETSVLLQLELVASDEPFSRRGDVDGGDEVEKSRLRFRVEAREEEL